MDALLDHGKIVADTVESDLDAARADMQALPMRRSPCSTSRDQLRPKACPRSAIRLRRCSARSSTSRNCSHRADSNASHCRWTRRRRTTMPRSTQLVKADFLKRLWAHDPTLWSPIPRRRRSSKVARDGSTIAQHMLESVPNSQKFRQRHGAEVRIRRRLRNGRQFARAGRDERNLRSMKARTLPELLRARFDVPAADQRTRRTNSYRRRRSSSFRARAVRPPNPMRSTTTSKRKSARSSARRLPAATSSPSPILGRRSKPKPKRPDSRLLR